jgi:hypothetical protein
MSVEPFGITLEQNESMGGRSIFFFSAEGATLPATHVREEAIDSAIFKRFEGAKWVVWRGPVGSISRSHNILNLCIEGNFHTLFMLVNKNSCRIKSP